MSFTPHLLGISLLARGHAVSLSVCADTRAHQCPAGRLTQRWGHQTVVGRLKVKSSCACAHPHQATLSLRGCVFIDMLRKQTKEYKIYELQQQKALSSSGQTSPNNEARTEHPCEKLSKALEAEGVGGSHVASQVPSQVWTICFGVSVTHADRLPGSSSALTAFRGTSAGGGPAQQLEQWPRPGQVPPASGYGCRALGSRPT